jgi:uncharacterized coiled-coil protein SlyX
VQRKGDYFETVERRISETESRIADQVSLIAKLKDQGRSADEAEGQLRNMLVGLKQLQRNRALMESFFNSKASANLRRPR